ncbi:MAG: NHL repeat-containing protein [Atribacterota bacterium]|nr:NHL repeat-containing protein [Atribacterota bacterium]MDI9607706.1 NHL repeat-containing protein [Atribacterota bacterium]HOA99253.1 NHL repeat-containing protein [Candidatus Atribacteria bacterium]HPZ40480.1 NHL repeat-containing protein [Candidatus Atribacteria bacterium]HQD33196.1 NHL repeat-containing protein [Candidatus Atribacteria bacterium]
MKFSREAFLAFMFLLIIFSVAEGASWEVEKIIEEVGGELPFLDYPVGILVDDQNQLVLVNDWGNNRFLSLTPDGQIQKALTGLNSPAGLGKDEQRNRIYIVEQKANQVRVINSDDFSTSGFLKAKTPLQEPRGIWIDEEGKIYVADTGKSRIVVFSPEGEELFTFGKEGMGNDEFYYPRGVAVDGDGHIWVVDTQHHCIKVFDEKGNFLFRFGQGGEGEEDFNQPRYLFIQGNWVFISDYRNHRIKVYNREGVLQEIMGEEGRGEGEFSFPEGLWIDKDGKLWIADAGNNRLQVIDVNFLINPKLHLASLLEEGESQKFMQVMERLSPEEREDPEVARLLLEFFRKRGDLDRAIYQAEDLFLNDSANRDYWKKTLGELYYEKGVHLREEGKLKEAQEFFRKSWQSGNSHSLFLYLWTSFLLLGGSNLFILILAIILLFLIMVFSRLRKGHYRGW